MSSLRDLIAARMEKPPAGLPADTVEAVDSTPPGWAPEAWKRFIHHVKSFDASHEYSHVDGGRLPKPHEWRPLRLCVQDVLIVAAVFRHNRENNNLEVDVFVTSELSEYEDLESVRTGVNLLLSEAYQSGGTMEIKFTHNVESGTVPQAIQEIATQHNISLSRATEGIITPEESKELYLNLADFSPQLISRIKELAENDTISPEQASYAFHNGRWTQADLDTILRGSDCARSILTGAAEPEDRLAFRRDLSHGTVAVLGGRLDRQLSLRGSEGIVNDDDPISLNIDFVPDIYAKLYSSEEPLALPWAATEIALIKPGQYGLIAVRARNCAEIVACGAQDIKSVSSYRPSSDMPVAQRAILFSADFDALQRKDRESLIEMARDQDVALLVCQESLLQLEADTIKRLVGGKIARKC